MNWIVELIVQMRERRAAVGIPAHVGLALAAHNPDPTTIRRLREHADLLKRVGRLSSDVAEKVWDTSARGAIRFVIGGVTYFLEGPPDFDWVEEKIRLKRQEAERAAEVAKFDAKLKNPGFLKKADPAVIDETRERRDEAERARRALNEILDSLDRNDDAVK
ncbi:MAG: hypothetical protein WDO24_17130 [Pseudomonadota bacterium]